MGLVWRDELKTNSRLYYSGSMALLGVFLLAASVGCGPKRGGADVIATVDGRKIYRADLERY